MGCATTTVKITYIVFNILLAIISIAGIVCVSLNHDYFREELAIAFYTTLSLCVGFACLGIFAAIRESVCLTATCAAFLLILTLVNVAIAIIGIGGGELNGVEMVNRAWEKESAMNDLQMHHECCGKSSVNDYVFLGKPIPASCYINGDSSDNRNLYTQGCTEKMLKYYEEESYRFAILLWSCVAFEFFGFLLTVFLYINFRNSQRRMQF